MKLKKGETSFTVGEVAEALGVHPQTIRYYEREGVVTPRRSRMGFRIFTQVDIDRLKTIQSLKEQLGVNLAGAAVILRMRERMEEMEHEVDRFIAEMRSEISRELRRYEIGLKHPLVKSSRNKTITIPIEEEE